MEPEELLNEEKNNEESKKESPLVSLEPDLKLFNESIREVAIEIMVEGLSKYPIFIAHQHVQFIIDDGSCDHGMAFLTTILA